ncbi:DUF1772 domain-containing protein [Marinomonas algicola]|uniref:anthrone oxygenase family protein n=1 Tax=Marinomonas algicola TaxID=2773454 RepID=UPI00174C4D8F|nr:anthrone oxygenase family protein [Marinomonas algicola]
MIVLLMVITGIMAGIYFAFSVFIMKSLSQLPNIEGARAMNRINDVIIKTVFLPLFLGSTFWYAGLIIWSFVNWQSGQSTLIISASLVYIVGMFLITVIGNVPLNKKLKVSENDEKELSKTWPYYLQKWTQFNHLRTLSAMISLALLILSQT